MSTIEDALKQKRQELDAYNRHANPKAYVNSGQMDRDRRAGKITEVDCYNIVNRKDK